MVVAVFRSKLREGIEEEFLELGDKMLEIAESMPGFISYEVYKSSDGGRASIIQFETAEQLQAWRNQPEHSAAQTRGRERYYERYSLLVGEVDRESHFER